MEEYVIVLDYLPSIVGGSFDRKEPLVYAIGEEEYKLFELVAKPKANIMFGDRVFIGKDPAKRDVIDHVKRRVGYSDLTGAAQSELEYAVSTLVKSKEAYYVKFYNECDALSLRKHTLEELPGLGKKTMQLILDERKKGPFLSFEDMLTRIPALKAPEKFIVDRIVLELSDKENRKHLLFVKDNKPAPASPRADWNNEHKPSFRNDRGTGRDDRGAGRDERRNRKTYR
ncbi:MAG: DUF655 domain-containing protein [archaeon]|nr:DUF655 domain-containing protein [archaeon]